MDAMQEPIRCPHGGEVYVLADGSEYWASPCIQHVCDSRTVAPSQRAAGQRQQISAA